jgi:AcrR family transcriptional regulator
LTVLDTLIMERTTRKGKRARNYDATGRAAQAERNRLDVLDAAERLFLAEGYATTIAAIAAEAKVSVETVYKRFGGKPGLLRAIRDRRLGGSGPVHAETRSNRARRLALDPVQVVAEWGRLASEVAPLVSPILLLIRDAAATNPEMTELRMELDDERLTRMRANARFLNTAGHLRPGISAAQAAELMWTYSSPELFELLVLRRGWSHARYGQFVADSITAMLRTTPGAFPLPAAGSSPR